MEFSLKFSIIFCTLLHYSTSYIIPVRNTGDLRIPEPFLSVFCADFPPGIHITKLTCIICKGFDPSCFIKKTTTTSTSTTTPATTTTSQSTSTVTTTTVAPPTISSTSSTTTVTVNTTPATRSSDDMSDDDEN